MCFGARIVELMWPNGSKVDIRGEVGFRCTSPKIARQHIAGGPWAGTDPTHSFTPWHIAQATMLGDLNPMPLWAPVLMARNKTNITFGGVPSPTVGRCEVTYSTDDIFGSNLSVLSTGNGAFNTFAMVQPWHNRDGLREMDSKYDITTQSLPAFYSMTVMGGVASGRIGGQLRLREGTPDKIVLEELFDAGKIGDADIKYSFPYDQTNWKEDPESGEKGGVPLRWVECLDGALVLFRLGLLVFAVCSEPEQSGLNKCNGIWARRNRSYRNKWRFAMWARHNRSFRNKWFKLALLAFLVPLVSAVATTTTTPTPRNGHGTGAYQAESGVQMPPLRPPQLTPLCTDDEDSGAFGISGAPMPCSYFAAQPSVCASYPIAHTTCRAALRHVSAPPACSLGHNGIG